MGLSVVVGVFAELFSNDEDGAESFRADMASLNRYLESAGLAPHLEPEECETFSCSMYGYSGLHYLRRFAAHLALRGIAPIVIDELPRIDPIVEEYYRSSTEPMGSFQRFLAKKDRKQQFSHLMMHSDAVGYYLPHDFSEVLFPSKDFEIPGDMIGSSVRLRDECVRLATTLELPLDIDPESVEVSELIVTNDETRSILWQRYANESYVCLQLYNACNHSLETGAAIVFC